MKQILNAGNGLEKGRLEMKNPGSRGMGSPWERDRTIGKPNQQESWIWRKGFFRRLESFITKGGLLLPLLPLGQPVMSGSERMWEDALGPPVSALQSSSNLPSPGTGAGRSPGTG